MSNVKDEIKELIAEDNLKDAVKKMYNLNVKNSHDNNQIIILNARFNRIQKELASYTITEMNYKVEFHRIKRAASYLLDDLELD